VRKTAIGVRATVTTLFFFFPHEGRSGQPFCNSYKSPQHQFTNGQNLPGDHPVVHYENTLSEVTVTHCFRDREVRYTRTDCYKDIFNTLQGGEPMEVLVSLNVGKTDGKFVQSTHNDTNEHECASASRVHKCLLQVERRSGCVSRKPLRGVHCGERQ